MRGRDGRCARSVMGAKATRSPSRGATGAHSAWSSSLRTPRPPKGWSNCRDRRGANPQLQAAREIVARLHDAVTGSRYERLAERARGASNPVRLRGASREVDSGTGEVVREFASEGQPHGVILTPLPGIAAVDLRARSAHRAGSHSPPGRANARPGSRTRRSRLLSPGSRTPRRCWATPTSARRRCTPERRRSTSWRRRSRATDSAWNERTSERPADSARGADRNRTGVHGFAGRCVATPPRRRRWADDLSRVGSLATLSAPSGAISSVG
jgi:hypothetical protein